MDGWTDKRKKEMRERERDEIDHINWERVQFFKNKLPEVLCIKIHTGYIYPLSLFW